VWLFAVMYSNRSTMRDDTDKTGKPSAKAPLDRRRERLKLALRENLKRRKSQARGRGDITISSSNSDDVTAVDAGREHPDK
jgi:hypothetical protein